MNICASFILGLACLITDESLSTESYNVFLLVLLFMMLDLLNLFFSCLLLSFLACCLSLFQTRTPLPTLIGCIPFIYKLGLYFCYIALFPFCIVIFVDDDTRNIENITYIFLIYQMIVAGLFLLNGCYGLVKKETRSQHLLEIESQRSFYQVDDLEIELWEREVLQERGKWKGSFWKTIYLY